MSHVTIPGLGLFSLVLLAGCVSAPPEQPAAALAVDSAEITAANATQVRIENFEDETECRREAPTGSRISVRTCVKPSTKTDPVTDYVTRDQIEQLRQQQMIQEQARQAREAAERARVLGTR